MNNDKLKKYVETKIAMLQQEPVSKGLDYYEIGLKEVSVQSDAWYLYDSGFDVGKCQGELDALMMVHALMDKGVSCD